MTTAEAIITNAPVNFINTLKRLGTPPNTARYLMGTDPETARQLIRMMAGTKDYKKAVLDAYELYLSESGQVVYKLARTN